MAIQLSYRMGDQVIKRKNTREQMVYFFNTVILVLFSLLIIIQSGISWSHRYLLVQGLAEKRSRFYGREGFTLGELPEEYFPMTVSHGHF